MKTSLIDASRLEAFMGLSERIRGADPRWVRPLAAVDARDLTGQGAFGRYAETQLLLSEADGQVVARAAAIVNPRLPGVGQLGHFESVDDAAALTSLLDAARPWFAARGVSEVWGPMNGAAHRPHRLMTAGFEREPFLFEPRNPAYYPALFEANGFAPIKTWQSYELPTEALEAISARLAKAVGRSQAKTTLIPFDMSAPDLPRLHTILDRVWVGHAGYAPMAFDEFVETYGGLVAITVAPYLGIAETHRGQDVAIGLCYPDFVDEVRALQGDASGWAQWMGQGLPKRLILHTVAVVPEERGMGPTLQIVDHAARHLRGDGFEQVVVALVQDGFRFFRRFAEPTREYALYGRPLASS